MCGGGEVGLTTMELILVFQGLISNILVFNPLCCWCLLLDPYSADCFSDMFLLCLNSFFFCLLRVSLAQTVPSYRIKKVILQLICQ